MFKLPVLVGFGCWTNPVSATLVFYINFLYQSTVFNSVPVRHQWHCQAYTLYSLMFCTNMLMNFSLYPGTGDEKAEEEEEESGFSSEDDEEDPSDDIGNKHFYCLITYTEITLPVLFSQVVWQKRIF